MWNCRDLVLPVVSSSKILRSEVGDVFQTLKRVCKEINHAFNEESVLEKESYITKRLIYRSSGHLRNSKVLRGIRKIQQCLNRWEELNLVHFADTISHILTSAGTAHIYLPSRPMVQYLLLRLLGTAHLCERTMKCCMETHVHVLGYLDLGHFQGQMLFHAGLVSRIWVLFRGYLKECIRLYAMLRPTETVLPDTEVTWLQEGTSLPGSLDELDPIDPAKLPSTRMISDGQIVRNDTIDTETTGEDKMDMSTAVSRNITSADGENNSLPVKTDTSGSLNVDYEDMGIPISRKKIKKKKQKLKNILNKAQSKQDSFLEQSNVKLKLKKKKSSCVDKANSEGDENMNTKLNVPIDKSKKVKKKRKDKSTESDVRREPVARVTKQPIKSLSKLLLQVKTAENFTQLKLVLKNSTFKNCCLEPAVVLCKVKLLSNKYKEANKMSLKEKLLNKGKTVAKKVLRDFVKSR